MDNSWIEFIESESKKPYMIELKKFITECEKNSSLSPPRKLLMRPFELCRYQMTKVVIIGGEPYPYGADGLAFSTPSPDTPLPLKAIFKEIYDDFFEGGTYGIKVHQKNSLEQWADQGVLLINSVWTAGQDVSHKNKGWETFTAHLVEWLSKEHPNHLSFCLWGKTAQNFKYLIDSNRHQILESEHPSLSANKNVWYGNRHFTKVNQFINKHYYGKKATIQWGTWKR